MAGRRWSDEYPCKVPQRPLARDAATRFQIRFMVGNYDVRQLFDSEDAIIRIEGIDMHTWGQDRHDLFDGWRRLKDFSYGAQTRDDSRPLNGLDTY